MEEIYFSLFLLLRTTKQPGHEIWNKHKNTLKDGEKAVVVTLELQDPKNNVKVNSLSFLFALYILLGSKEASNLEMPKYANKKEPQQNPVLSPKNQEVGSFSPANFEWRAEFHPHQAVMGYPILLLGWCQRRLSSTLDFTQLGSNEEASTSQLEWCQRRLTRESELSPLLSSNKATHCLIVSLEGKWGTTMRRFCPPAGWDT